MTTTAMINLLRKLAGQAGAADARPGAYSPHLTPGTKGCHAATSEALVDRGLVDVVEHPAFGRCIQINGKGRAAILASAH